MSRSVRRILLVFIIVSLGSLSCEIIPACAGPGVVITKVSPNGTRNGFVWGHAYGLRLNQLQARYRVACYIQVDGGWWNKPYWSKPLTKIGTRGNFKIDITTGGIDQFATAVVLFLMPRGVAPVRMAGDSYLPDQGVAEAEVFRSPPAPTVASSKIGTNQFIDVPPNGFIEENDLHLSLSLVDSQWKGSSTEIKNPLSCGTHVAVTKGWLSDLDPNIVVSLFAINSAGTIVFSRLGDPDRQDNVQFFASPGTSSGQDGRSQNLIVQTNEFLTHVLEWEPTGIKVKIFSGQWSEQFPPDSALLAEWEYTGPLPDPVHASLGFSIQLLDGKVPYFGQGQELVIESVVSYPTTIQ